jgi:hypothetical protein
MTIISVYHKWVTCLKEFLFLWTISNDLHNLNRNYFTFVLFKGKCFVMQNLSWHLKKKILKFHIIWKTRTITIIFETNFSLQYLSQMSSIKRDNNTLIRSLITRIFYIITGFTKDPIMERGHNIYFCNKKN